MYRIESGIWSRVFAVPSDIVDKHLKLCGALPLKVLLILLRHGRTMSAQELASMLGQSVGDINDAMHYWMHLGVVQLDAVDEGMASAPVLEYAEVPAVPETPGIPDMEEPARREEPLPEGRKLVQLGRPRRLTGREVSELAETDKNVHALLAETQAAFGRPLKPTESESVATIYVRFEMPPDLILMLLQYCISIGKNSMAYIERVAQDWYERGIDTHERVEEELMRLSRQSEVESAIRAAFGIYGRHITDREREFFLHWIGELKMSMQLIKLAYERNVDMKGRMSFAYMNGILSDWHKKGITTPEAALRDMQGVGTERAKGPAEPKASYDLDKFEQLLSSGSLWD